VHALQTLGATLKPWRKVRCGSWLCENARKLGGDRTNYSLKTNFAINRASVLNLENELKNVILAEFRSFAFSHSQGHKAAIRTGGDDFCSAPDSRPAAALRQPTRWAKC
jgi:hypothetical protein